MCFAFPQNSFLYVCVLLSFKQLSCHRFQQSLSYNSSMYSKIIYGIFFRSPGVRASPGLFDRGRMNSTGRRVSPVQSPGLLDRARSSPLPIKRQSSPLATHVRTRDGTNSYSHAGTLVGFNILTKKNSLRNEYFGLYL